MGRTKLLVSCLLLITLSGAFLGSARSNGKPSSPTTVLQKVTMACPALQEVIKNDRTFDIMYWSLCTSKKCDHKDTTWDWIAGMNNRGITQVGRERFNITYDGSLEIHQVNLSDTGQYMCTVKTINQASPEVYHTNLVVVKDATSKWDKRNTKTNKNHYEKDHSEDSKKLVYPLAVTTSVVSVLLVITVVYIVYLKRNYLRCWNQGNSPA